MSKTGASSREVQMPKPKTKFEVFAEWEIDCMRAELGELELISVSCGVGEAQGDGYTLADKGAELIVSHGEKGYVVTFSAPSEGLEKEKDYWLSPSTLGSEGLDVEACRWGIRPIQG